MKILAIDGSNLLNRAFYAIRPLNSNDGTPVNAVYGFLSIILKLLDEEKPDGICVCFDLKEPTFRHKEYANYKAQRKAMPEELAVQFPIAKELVKALSIPCLEMPGFEADDLLGGVAKKCEEGGASCIIVTGDRDALSLIGGRTMVRLIITRGGKTEEPLYDATRLLMDYGVTPSQMLDLKALMGDSSDNIPGVRGVGEKTALSLIERFGNLDGIYENIDSSEIRDSLRKKLVEDKEMAYLSRRLVTICKDQPEHLTLDELKLRPYDEGALYNMLASLNFASFIKKLGLSPSKGKHPETEAEECDVFAVSPSELKGAVEGAQRVFFCVSSSLDTLAVCKDEKTCYTVCKNDWDGEDFDSLVHWFFSEKVKKCGHNIKPAMLSLFEQGINFGGFEFDTALAAFLLDKCDNSLDISQYAPLPAGLAPGSIEQCAVYAAATASVYQSLYDGIIERGMERLYFEVELPLCEVCASLQHVGAKIDEEKLRQFGQELKARIDALAELIYTLAGGEFNINSPKQLGEVLFVKLSLPPVKKTSTGFSTDVSVLERLRGFHEIIDLLLEYRELSKLKSTYADGLLKVISPKDQRIHSSFNQTGAITGRISSTDPNLQNIPVRRALGSELRRMFVAPEGYLLVDADYSQIELRILAHIAKDEAMIAGFESGDDIHAITAAKVFGVERSDVTSQMRSSAKAVNFGIVYGISDFSLAQDIGVTRYEAHEYIENYFKKYSGVRRYMEEIKAFAREHGYVETLLKRRRYLPDISSKNFNIRSAAERIALNTPIQGAAADIMKIAMVNVYNRLKRENLRARLILQVHDELLVEAPVEETEYVKKLLTEEMENALPLSVRLTAEASAGENWLAAK